MLFKVVPSKNLPRILPVTSFVQVVYWAHDTIYNPYEEFTMYYIYGDMGQRMSDM